MSSDKNEEKVISEDVSIDENEANDPRRVIETKHVFPENYDCKSCVKKESKYFEKKKHLILKNYMKTFQKKAHILQNWTKQFPDLTQQIN